jgi:hypothetical protein
MTMSSVISRSEKAKCSFFRVRLDSSSSCVYTQYTRIANIPHNPVRFADTVGIVIERVRPRSSLGTSGVYRLTARILMSMSIRSPPMVLQSPRT